MKQILYATTLLSCLGVASSALAQDLTTMGGLSGDVLSMIQKAAARDNGAHLQSVALIAIEADPAKAPDVLAAIQHVAPDRVAAIRTAVHAAMPDVTLGEATAPAVAEAAAAPAAPTGLPPRKSESFWDLSEWKGNVELSGARSTGNTKQTSLGTAASAAREMGDWTHKFSGLIDFERSAGATTKRRWLVAYDPRYALSDRAYIFGIFQYEADRFSGFDSRFAETIGIGYRLIKTDRFIFDVEAGPGARQTKFTDGTSENEFAATGRTHFEWIISDSSSFIHDFLYVWGSSQQTIDTTAALKMRINGALSARLSYNYRYNTDVPIGNVKTDTVTRAALVYDF